MLQKLSVKNFALIESLEVDFNSGLSTITGETGAGKSLLLGALGLIIGKRVDTSVIKDSEKKCVVEAVFNITDYHLSTFFEENDLDFEEETYIRREILPSGKSRAFVNDSPVTLSVLSQLGAKLIDIHSQHQTVEVTQTDFQFYILDALAKNNKELESYKRGLKQLKQSEKELSELKANQKQLQEEYNYNSFLLSELEEAKIKIDEQLLLEEAQEKLANTEEIQERLSFVVTAITAESHGAFDQLTEAKNNLSKITNYAKDYEELSTRLESICIDLDDLRTAIETQAELVNADPEALQKTSDRLQLLYSLQKKHQVADNKGLLELQETLTQKVSSTENANEAISSLETKIDDIKSKLNTVADKIHHKREKVVKKLTSKLEGILSELGMQNAQFNPILERVETFNNFGGSNFELQFSANKGGQFGTLKKVASGGELSRIMLAVKMLLSEHIKLPTIIFDEIDTGVSGEVAQKMAHLLKEMGHYQQVFSITHLPQIAAKGSCHYKVFKQDVAGVTQTKLKQLTTKERVNEIAEMIGGKQLSDAAKSHAESLLLNT